MTGKGLFLPLKGTKSHAIYDIQTPSGPIYLSIKYRNFAHSRITQCFRITDSCHQSLGSLGRKAVQGLLISMYRYLKLNLHS